MANGKSHAFAIGKMLMPSSEIDSKTRGHAIETIHILGDPLWRLGSVLLQSNAHAAGLNSNE